MSQLACAFAGIKGEMIALKDVSISAVLRDLLADVTVSQTYRNDERTNIEAVYTFPLPLDALLLDVDIVIGNRHLKGNVVEKRAAERSYEHALEASNAAVMIEPLEPGVYTMNVGNLLPGETITVSFRYAMLYRWAGERLRIMLPTTIAARYGVSPHLPHQAPETSLFAENRCSITIEVFGVLQNAQFHSPSHAVELTRSAGKTILVLNQERTAMDRDFVLNVRAPQAPRSFLLTGKDGSDLAAVVSFQPFFPGLRQNRALTIALVIDCSGSMQGDSIAQARHALGRIVESLGSSDRFTIIQFGSTTHSLWPALQPCTSAHRDTAIRFAETIQASMGGTEIGNALEVAYAQLAGREAGDILLVTDGQVSSWQPVVDRAKLSGHRIFTVGVGNAVSEAFVRQLASETGGECELVSPREDMAERIVRHFERIRSPRATRVRISWPGNAIEQYPSTFRTVFDGDTVVGFARLPNAAAPGPVVLEAELETGETLREELATSQASFVDTDEDVSTLARMVAGARLKEAGAENGLQTALRYRLLSPWTNWIAVVERPEEQKALDIPAIRRVPQTFAAGAVMGATRSVMMPARLAMPAPASAAPPRHPTRMPQEPLFSGVFDLEKRASDDLADALTHIESKGMATMIEFLALVRDQDWDALAKWASMMSHASLAQEASSFRNLLHSTPVVDLTETQTRHGLEILMKAAMLGFRLNPTIFRQARRRGIL